VHIHYLLSSDTVVEQMYDLIDQKWAALRAVHRRGATSQDREAQHKTVAVLVFLSLMIGCKPALEIVGPELAPDPILRPRYDTAAVPHPPTRRYVGTWPVDPHSR
jgi:hypothetical protein